MRLFLVLDALDFYFLMNILSVIMVCYVIYARWCVIVLGI